MSRIMSIDYGDARIGVALTDPLKIIASGYNTYQNDENIFSTLFLLSREKKVASVVVGIPFDQDSKIGHSALNVIKFAKTLKDHFIKNGYDIPFYGQDERYTTHDAYDAMKKIKVKKKRKKGIVDQIAAAKILSDFMASTEKNEIDFKCI